MPNENESVVFLVEVDDSSVEKGMSDAKKKITKAANETAEAQKKAQDSVSENAEANSEKVVNSTEKADKKVKQSAEETADARKKAQDDAARNAEENDKKIVDSAEKTNQNVTDSASRGGEERVRKDKENTEKLKKHQSDYEEKAKKTAENVKKFYIAAGAAIVAETTAAITAAANYQTSYAKVFTLTADGTDEAAYAESIRQASKNTGVKVTDMSESVYGAISASVDQDSAVDFTENAVKLAKGGFTETATAVDVLTTAINAYGLAADDATHISDVLITTQNLGKTTVDELAHSMGQTIPIANSAGVAIEELSTMYAVMTKNGVATAESGTQIKAMLNELNASGTNVDKTLREITGKSFAELKSEGQTTADVLNTLNSYAETSGQKLSDLFGSVEAGAAALTLVKDGGKDFAGILDQMNSSAGAAETAYEKMANTTEEKVGKLLNKITIMFAEAGEEMLPLVDELIEYVDENADEIEGIIQGIGEMMKNVIITCGDVLKVLWEHKEAVAAVAAAFVAYKTAVAISAVIDKFKKATEGATIAQKALNVAMEANPAGLIASAIAALTVGAVALSNSLLDCGGRMDDMNAKASDLITAAKEYRDKSEKLSDISAKYEEIKNSEEDAAAKSEELKLLQQELIDQYGDQASGIDLVNGELNEQIGLIDSLIDKNRKLAKATAEEALAEAQAAEKEGSAVNTGIMLFNMGNTEIAQWAAQNLSTYDVGWSALGSSAGTARIQLNGSYEDRAADWEKFYNYLTEERGLSANDDLVKQVREQWSKMTENADVLKELEDAVESFDKVETEAASTVETAVNHVDKYNKILSESASGQKELKQRTKDLDESTKTLIDEYGVLYDRLKDLEKGGSLNYDQMQELIKLYPMLEDKIKLTANGYTLETDALGDLSAALDESVAATIEAEKQKTEAAIKGAEDRIEVMKKEMAALAASGDTSRAKEIKASLEDEWASLQELRTKISGYNTIADYLKGDKGKTVTSEAGSSSGGSSGNNDDPKELTNEQKFDKEYADLKYRHGMGEINDKTFYNGVDILKNKYLEENSTKWRSVNVSRHNWEESQRKSAEEEKTKSAKSGTTSSGKSSASSGTVISINSYIPTVWDTEEEKAEKIKRAKQLKKTVGKDLTGGGMYDSVVRSITENALTVGSTAASTSPVQSASEETGLSDVVNAIKELQTADENKQISLEVILKARDLIIGKIAAADINDITKMNGKSPLKLE